MDIIHLVKVITAYRPTAFAKKLKASTRKEHDEIERHPFVQKLISGSITDEEYTAYLDNLLLIYTTIEGKVLLYEKNTDLKRSHLIIKDLFDYKTKCNVEVGRNVCNRDWLQNIESKDTFGCTADFYIRWLGDLYGGQIMSKNFKFHSSLIFNNVRSCIKRAREVIEVNAKGREDEFINLVKQSYRFNYNLVQELWEKYR